MSVLIVSVGGTGQLVLQQFLSLYLLGYLPDSLSFHAVSVDTSSSPNKTLAILKNFLDRLQIGTLAGELLRRPLPRVAFLSPELPAHQSQVSAALTNRSEEDLPVDHPARSFFSRDLLRMQVAGGMYARPALEAVLDEKWRDTEVLAVEDARRVILVGSVVGGTGGGLLVPLVNQMCDQQQSRPELQVRAVLFGQWFRATSKVIHESDNRFLSNQVLALKAIEEVGDRLRCFGIAGADRAEGRVVRESQREAKGINLPWPSGESHPIWQGTRLLYHLALEEHREHGRTFEERDIPPEEVQQADAPELTRVRNALDRRLGIAEAIVDYSAIRRMASDPLATDVWGETLVAAVADLWQVAQLACKGDQVSYFPRRLQVALRTTWSELQGAFPKTGLRGRLSDVRAIKWPQIEANAISLERLEGNDVAAERCAALLLWSALGAKE